MTGAARAVRTRALLGLLAWLLAPACGGREEAGPDLAGHYVLDRPAYARRLLPDPLPADAGQRQQALDRARAEAERVDVELRIDADGTFLVRTRYDAEEGRYRGVWSRRGERLSLRATHAQAGELPAGEPIEARTDGEAIDFPAGVVPRPFRLRRR